MALGVVAAHHAEGRRFAELLRNARPAWLGAAAALQVATYVCAAAVWQRALRRNGGVRRSVRSLVPLGLAKLFADQGPPAAARARRRVEAALAATLLARGFTFWLPIVPGLAIARREMMRGTASAGQTAGAVPP